MAIVKMRKFRLLAFRSQKDELLRELMLLGCLEVNEPDELIEDSDEISAIVKRETSNITAVKNEQQLLIGALDILNRYAPVKTSIFAKRPAIDTDDFLNEQRLSEGLETARLINEADIRIRQIISEGNSLSNSAMSLKPWRSLNMALDYTGTNNISVAFGSLPKTANISDVSAALDSAVQEAQIYNVDDDDAMHYIMLISHKSVFSGALETLRSFGYTPASCSGMKGTSADNLNDIKEKLKKLKNEKELLEQSITEKASCLDELKLCIDLISTKVARCEVTEKLLGTNDTVCLIGWVTKPEEGKLIELLKKYDCAWDFDDPSPIEYPRVPIKLKNNVLTRSLNMVTEMYSLPDYSSVDPNPLMAPFFILFYGIMMADMGYGLLMILISLFVCKKIRPRGTMKNMFELMGWCGGATFIMGALTGGFFGDLLTHLIPLIKPGAVFTGLPALFSPLNDTLYVLVGSLVLGFIQIIAGMVINFVKTTKDGHFWDALMDNGSWWLLFLGIGLGALGVTWWVAIAGVVALIATQGRSKPTIPGKIIGGISSLYDITSYFGDILSYSRLMALMLAGSVIAQVFNTLAAIPGNILIFIPIFLIGHALNIGLNLLGCYVHDLRLQCLEYFGKFYKDGGKPFNPLSIKTKYVDVVNK